MTHREKGNEHGLGGGGGKKREEAGARQMGDTKKPPTKYYCKKPGFQVSQRTKVQSGALQSAPKRSANYAPVFYDKGMLRSASLRSWGGDQAGATDT